MTTTLAHVKRGWLYGLMVGLMLAAMAGPCPGLVDFDFEMPYLVHPGRQIWDFCLVQDQGNYHLFYHTIPQQAMSPANADTIWHAVSSDLRRWAQPIPVLTSGPDWWDAVAIWAPDVVYDPVSARWAMLYTGVASGMVQRACLAWSPDLKNWTKSLANPVFEPDSLTYHWAPDQAWSSFRDPFVYNDGTQWNMLSTAGLRLGGYPGYRRGIIHRAVSTDLEHWQDAGPFYIHDGATGLNFDLESPQYIVRGGWHHLFFTEQDPSLESAPTSHMVAADPSGWTMTQRDVVDPGWAPEIEHFGAPGGADVFARLAKGQDPRDETWFVTAKFDSVRYDNGGMTPVVFDADPLDGDWPVRTGIAGGAAPTFGDNAVLRGSAPLRLQGNGCFSSREDYGGPLTGIGQPGAALPDQATGTLESRPFTLSTGYLGLMLAGGRSGAEAYVTLVDAASDQELARIEPHAGTSLQERTWNVTAHVGTTVKLRIVDADTLPGGWIAADWIREVDGPSGVDPGPGTPPAMVTELSAYPNPFNAGTVIRFRLREPGVCRLDIFDLAGRRIWRSQDFLAATGRNELSWDGTDGPGQALPSAVYLYRVSLNGAPAAAGRITLVK